MRAGCFLDIACKMQITAEQAGGAKELLSPRDRTGGASRAR